MIWPEPPKGFSVSRHMKKVKALKGVFSIYEEKIMSTPLFEDMLAEIAHKCGYANTILLRDRLPAILPPNGHTIDSRALLRLGMFLLENHTALEAGTLTPGWCGMPHTWVAGLIGDVIKCQGIHPGVATRYTLEIVVLTGPPAGQIIPGSVSIRYATYLPRILGAPTKTQEWVRPTDAAGMYLLGKYGTTRAKPVALMEVTATPAMKARNKQLFNRRHPRASV